MAAESTHRIKILFHDLFIPELIFFFNYLQQLIVEMEDERVAGNKHET